MDAAAAEVMAVLRASAVMVAARATVQRRSSSSNAGNQRPQLAAEHRQHSARVLQTLLLPQRRYVQNCVPLQPG